MSLKTCSFCTRTTGRSTEQNLVEIDSGYQLFLIDRLDLVPHQQPKTSVGQSKYDRGDDEMSRFQGGSVEIEAKLPDRVPIRAKETSICPYYDCGACEVASTTLGNR